MMERLSSRLTGEKSENKRVRNRVRIPGRELSYRLLSRDDSNNEAHATRQMIKYMGILTVLVLSAGVITLWFIIMIQSSVEKFSINFLNEKPNSEKTQHCEKDYEIWPSESEGDRIIEQLNFIPPAYTRDEREFKKIFYYNPLSFGKFSHGKETFKSLKCPVDTCTLSQLGYHEDFNTSDAVVFTHADGITNLLHSPEQIWVILITETPFFFRIKNKIPYFNWTATFKRESDIVTPYAYWKYYDNEVRYLDQGTNHAEGKTKKVAWFVSNCRAKNNRLEYALELAEYIDVDIYGKCGPHPKRCSRYEQQECFDMLNKEYKFYLSFENSNCRDYITEKFFINGLSNNVIPVVMGAHPEDYKRVAPEGSYIHVDDFDSPERLAEYLHLLDSDDRLYDKYFRWKSTGDFIETNFFCRLCALLHDECHQPQYYEDLPHWWGPESTCVPESWNRN